MQVLVIESSKMFQQILKDVFSRHGIEVVALSDSEQAMELAGIQKFDLICLSLKIQGKSGIELAREFRQIPMSKSTPILMITSESNKDLLTSSLTAGITEIFNKSNIEELDSYLYDFMVKNRMQQSLVGTILLVEDSKAGAAIIRSYLEAIGMEVVHFEDASQAYKEIEKNDFDLIITDVVLPGEMTGLSLTRAVRRMAGAKKRIPILAITALDDTARKLEILHSGANDYVHKSVHLEEIQARVRNLVTLKKLWDQIDRQQEQLQDMAMKDPLTGLYNRNFLLSYAEKSIRQAHRHQHDLSLLVIDLDSFKQINDQFGHTVGDSVLIETSGILTKNCRKEDVAARFGGDEFLVLLPHCNLDFAQEKAGLLLQMIGDLGNDDMSVSASIGLAILQKDESFDDLFSHADKALYQAKEAGRGCFKIITE